MSLYHSPELLVLWNQNLLFPYGSMGAHDSWGMANLNPRSMAGKIYIGNHLTLLHTLGKMLASLF